MTAGRRPADDYDTMEGKGSRHTKESAMSKKDVSKKIPAKKSARAPKAEAALPSSQVETADSLSSLAAVAPQLKTEWYASKNGPLTPDAVDHTSRAEVWWKCRRAEGHVWQMAVHHRVRGMGCPHCAAARRDHIEKHIAAELSSLLAFDPSNHQVEAQGSLIDVDMVVYGLKLVIEYDDAKSHDDSSAKDQKKNRDLTRAGWSVLRLREAPLGRISKDDVLLPLHADVKTCASLALRKVMSLFELRSKRMSEYLAGDKLLSSLDVADLPAVSAPGRSSRSRGENSAA